MRKVLILDIETFPNLAYVWRLYEQNVNLPNLAKEWSMLSWAAKWVGSDEIFYSDIQHDTERRCVEKIRNLLEQADIVVAHNLRFDLSKINARIIYHKLPPVPSITEICTLKLCRKHFGFLSNKLDYVCQHLGIEGKYTDRKYRGIELWKGCIREEEEAYKELEIYNKQDVIMLEALLYRLAPYVKLPNMIDKQLAGEPSLYCPKCGSEDLNRRGFYDTNSFVYQRYQCKKCGSWTKDVNREKIYEKPQCQPI